MNNCEHRWKTRNFIETNGKYNYAYTHYTECIKCGALRTIIYEEKPQDETKTE